MSIKWTRNQKLMLWGIIASLIIGIGGWIAKIEIKINRIQDTVDSLRVKGSLEVHGKITTKGSGRSITFDDDVVAKEGTWRIRQDDDVLKFEQKRDGKWETASRMDSKTTVSEK